MDYNFPQDEGTNIFCQTNRCEYEYHFHLTNAFLIIKGCRCLRTDLSTSKSNESRLTRHGKGYVCLYVCVPISPTESYWKKVSLHIHTDRLVYIYIHAAVYTGACMQKHEHVCAFHACISVLVLRNLFLAILSLFSASKQTIEHTNSFYFDCFQMYFFFLPFLLNPVKS